MEEKIVYIVGLGLIGASLAMGIRKAISYNLLGYNRSQASRDIALKKGIVDKVTADLEEFACQADVIIVSLPVKQTIQTFQQLANIPLKEGVIVTDVGSTKGAIVKAGQAVFNHLPVRFVGWTSHGRESQDEGLPLQIPPSLKMLITFTPQLRLIPALFWNEGSTLRAWSPFHRGGSY